MSTRFFSLLMFVSSFACAQGNRSLGTSIRHVSVVDVTTGTELRNQTVIIQDDRITSVALTNDAEGDTVGAIDGHGAYLVPGFWDMHVHVNHTGELPLYIVNGVTGIRIMSGARNSLAFRTELASTALLPQILLASAIVDGSPPTWPGSIIVRNPAEARQGVSEIKASGADFIKIYNGIPKAAYFALAEEAKQEGLTFAGHVPDTVTVQEASAAGQRSVEHLQGIALGCSDRQRELMQDLQGARLFLDRQLVFAKGYRSYNAEKCQALFGEFRRNHTWQVPTLTVLQIWGHLDENAFRADKRLAYVDKHSREHWEQRTQFERRTWGSAQYLMERQLFAADKQVVGAMFRAGVPIMAGTDAMNPFCFPGFSLHDELAFLVESGLTPLAALQAATINPAEFMGRTEQMGTISIGKEANLVLLHDDPLTDIRNTSHILAVWLRGRYLDRAALDAILAAAKRNISKD